MIMNERIEDLQDFVGQLGDCVPPKSSIQRKNVLNRIRKAKEVTDDIKELVNAATEENISKFSYMIQKYFSHYTMPTKQVQAICKIKMFFSMSRLDSFSFDRPKFQLTFLR